MVPTDSSDGRPSDTEELMRGDNNASEIASEKDVCEEKPDNDKNVDDQDSEKKELNFEVIDSIVEWSGGKNDETLAK